MLAALALKREIGLFFVNSKVALQDTLGAITNRRASGNSESFAFSASRMALSISGPTKNPITATKLISRWLMEIRLAVLKVDHADQAVARKHRHGEQRLIAVFRQFVEHLKSRIKPRIVGDRDRFSVLSDPAGDSLPHSKFQAIQKFGMRIFRGAQNQIVFFENIYEAGIAFNGGGSEVHNKIKNCA